MVNLSALLSGSTPSPGGTYHQSRTTGGPRGRGQPCGATHCCALRTALAHVLIIYTACIYAANP